MIKLVQTVTLLARIIGQLCSKSPYINQRITPIKKKLYISSEMLLVFLVLMVLTTCGNKEDVVMMAASEPIRVAEVIEVVFFVV